ncbi:MAG: hypothetical protein Q8R92_16115 [Deltaproteobacteria bacterium]|nr:hypothetical protein [Deltaproteobacteria bacterium]
MTLTAGEKIHVITRRLFENDLRRHFIGEVEACTDILIRARGFAFVYDEGSNDFTRREETRTRIFSLLDANLIVNVLPKDVAVEDIRYRLDDRNRRLVTDGKGFAMNISEFGAQR